MEIIKVSKTVEIKVISRASGHGYPRQCAETKLVLINVSKDHLHNSATDKIDNAIKIGYEWYDPILISETEEIVKGDRVYVRQDEINGIGEVVADSTIDKYGYVQVNIDGRTHKYLTKNCNKILSLPEHFTPKQLQDIVDGKMKDGDHVHIECEEIFRGRENGKNINEKQTIIYQPLTLHLLDNKEDKTYTSKEVENLLIKCKNRFGGSEL